MTYENAKVLRVSLNNMYKDRLSIKTNVVFKHINSKGEEVDTDSFSYGLFPMENLIADLCGRVGRRILRKINSVTAESVGVIDALLTDATITFERVEHEQGDALPVGNGVFDSKGYHTIVKSITLSDDKEVIADLNDELNDFAKEKRAEKIAGKTNLFDDWFIFAGGVKATCNYIDKVNVTLTTRLPQNLYIRYYLKTYVFDAGTTLL